MSAFDYRTDPAWAPRIHGVGEHANLDAACDAVIAAMEAGATVHFSYHCLSQFHITLGQSPLGVDMVDMEVRIGFYGGNRPAPMPLKDCGAQTVSARLGLKPDDADAVSFLLGKLGAAAQRRPRATVA